MSETNNLTVDNRVTFLELFNRHSVVEIPLIQRDYVQGRSSELEVRTEFLKALYTALSKPEGDRSLPLDLDFVYGSVEKKDSERVAFCPLDGQQRLTTLFLLHWYLAWRDGKGAIFTTLFKIGEKSRFSYAVRTSSHEFFDALVSWIPGNIPAEVLSLSNLITDQSWFFRSWKLDPTIQSALTMLDLLHEKFSKTDGFYDRLVKTDLPYITFQLLDLQNFGLSDDLYIKMNARGKPLTAFETFKARLEQHLDVIFPKEKLALHGNKVSIKDYFSHKIDTVWADLFWKYRDVRTNLYDDRVMHLLRAVATVTRNPDATGYDLVLQDLRSSWVKFSYLKYQDHKCLDRPLIDTLIAILDRWSGGSEEIKTLLVDNAYYDEKSVFERIIKDSTRLTYPDLVLFNGYCSFILKHGSDIQTDQFGEWMRVLRNLTVNTIYDSLEDFKRSIRSINELLSESGRILNHIADAKVEVQGFDRQQVREERLKAQLKLKSRDWCALIQKAEQHGYFNGQIEFLFKFSGVLDQWVNLKSTDWSVEEDAAFRHCFADYYAKAIEIFSAYGLNNFGEHRWERALLSIGNYLLPKGRNFSFLVDSERDTGWKRLLRGAIKTDDHVEIKRQYIKTLLDQINLNAGVTESLNLVIEQSNPSDEWRRLIVQNPEMIVYCENRMIRIQAPNCIYLLKKIRMSGEHVELFSYHLKTVLISPKFLNGELTPFEKLEYCAVKTDSEEPVVLLQCNCNGLTVFMSVFNDDGRFSINLRTHGGEFPINLMSALTETFTFKVKAVGAISRHVDRDNIEKVIDEVVSVFRQSASLQTL